MQKLFAKYLLAVVTIAFLGMTAAAWLVQTKNAQEHMLTNARLKLEQISQTLEHNDRELEGLRESLNEDYLTRAKAFAYIIEQNPGVLNSMEELERIKALLNVDELHVINEDGILFAGTIPLYYGMDFRSTKQTAEFLQILDDPEFCLAQEIQPNGAEQKMFQYAGVARKDQKGIVQVGLAPTRYLEAQKKNELPYILSHVPVEEGTTLFIVDGSTGEFLAHSSERFMGKNISDVGFSLEQMSDYENGCFHTFDGRRRFYVIQKDGPRYLGISVKEVILYRERTEQMRILAICFLLISLIVLFAINRLVKVQIVNGIHKINRDLEAITEGRLDTVVCVEDNTEFKQLSTQINQMVVSILEGNVKVSRVIDMVDMPIGVFEIAAESGLVMSSSRLYRILGWDEEGSREGGLFMKRLKTLMKDGVTSEPDVYRDGKDPEKWLRIQLSFDGSRVFGVVHDVTREMLEKQKIKHERDYDTLTGLRNIAKFKRKAERLLNSGENLGCAAMLMMDLDHFKSINDRFGHDWGDTYLQLTAEYLREFEGPQGITARRSGDEFSVFLYHYDSREEICGRLDEFYQKLMSRKIRFPDGSTQTLAISSGVAWFERGCRYDEMMKAADDALYEAKNAGRNIYRCVEKESNQADKEGKQEE